MSVEEYWLAWVNNYSIASRWKDKWDTALKSTNKQKKKKKKEKKRKERKKRKK